MSTPDVPEPASPPRDLADAVEHARAALPAAEAPLLDQIEAHLTAVGWAEDEIVAARARHPGCDDVLWHSLPLLGPTHPRMRAEFVLRSHCRELLDRVAAGADTRPGTAAEAACALLDVARVAPLRSAAFGLHTRMWQAAGFTPSPEMAELAVRHEALEAATIDDHERWLRARLAVPGRHLSDVRCGGKHHAKPVRCRFAGPRDPG